MLVQTASAAGLVLATFALPTAGGSHSPGKTNGLNLQLRDRVQCTRSDLNLICPPLRGKRSR